MAETSESETCGAEFVPAGDGGSTGPCVRDGRHLIHRHSDGTRTIKAPFGAIVTKKRP